MGWFVAIVTLLAIGSAFGQEVTATRILLVVAYGVEIVLFWFLTHSFVWALAISGIISTVLGFWIMHKYIELERERKERDRQ